MTIKQFTILIFLTILGSSLTQTVEKLQYLKLYMYITHDCKYCKFVAQQVHQLIAQNAWQVIVDYEEIDCNKNIELCRDDLLKPLMMIWEINEDGTTTRKLGELGGTQSKIQIKDWVQSYFEIYAPTITKQSVQQLNDKYELERVTNPENTLKMYKALTAIDKIKEENRFNILDRVSNTKIQGSIHKLSDLGHGNLTHRNNNFLTGQEIKYLVGFGLIVMAIMYAVNKSGKKPIERVRIPSQQMD